jgi:hypothetical protein
MYNETAVTSSRCLGPRQETDDPGGEHYSAEGKLRLYHRKRHDVSAAEGCR